MTVTDVRFRPIVNDYVFCIIFLINTAFSFQNESGPTNLEYKLTSDKLAKRLWRIAVEHHTFFRSATVFELCVQFMKSVIGIK